MKKLVVSILTTILIFGVIISVIQVNPDGPFTDRFIFKERYDVAVK